MEREWERGARGKGCDGLCVSTHSLTHLFTCVRLCASMSYSIKEGGGTCPGPISLSPTHHHCRQTVEKMVSGLCKKLNGVVGRHGSTHSRG